MLLVHKAKNEINAHKNLVGLILDICEGTDIYYIYNEEGKFCCCYFEFQVLR